MNWVKMSVTAAAIAACACLAIAPQASAGTAHVRFADLDLSSAEGQAELQKRIATAARTVCSYTTTGTRIRSVDAECMPRARASIEHQLVGRRASAANGG
jgi:UrcA family protein